MHYSRSELANGSPGEGRLLPLPPPNGDTASDILAHPGVHPEFAISPMRECRSAPRRGSPINCRISRPPGLRDGALNSFK